jgi:hypothetical protein
MRSTLFKLLLLLTLAAGALVLPSVAATSVTAAVVPVLTAPRSTVFVHTGVRNLSLSNEAVTVTLKVTNPGTCVSGSVIPSNVGAFALGLRPNETRLADLSLHVPASACSGTYSVTVTVKNSAGAVLATHTSAFKVEIPTP